MSQTQLAAELTAALDKRVDPTTVTRLERGSRPTTLGEVYALADVLNVSIAALIPTDRAIDVIARNLAYSSLVIGRERTRHLTAADALQHRLTLVDTAAQAAHRLSQLDDLRTITDQSLTDLDALAALGDSDDHTVPFLDLLFDFLYDANELHFAEEWARTTIADDPDLDREDTVDWYRTLVEYLRNGRQASE